MSTIKVDTIATRTGSGNITASNTIAGNLTGNVTGNVTGNQSGGTVSATNITASGTITGNAGGSVSAPALGIITGGLGVNGIYSPAANSLGFVAGGAVRGRFIADGLTFGSDTAAANALGDYEEGTWLPTYGANSADGSVSYNDRVGVYHKIGRQVRIWCDINISAASGMSGVVQIKNLPYASASNSTLGTEASTNTQRYDMGQLSFWDVSTSFTSSRTPTAWISNGQSAFSMYSFNGDSATGHASMAINQTGRIAFSAIYTADN